MNHDASQFITLPRVSIFASAIFAGALLVAAPFALPRVSANDFKAAPITNSSINASHSVTTPAQSSPAALDHKLSKPLAGKRKIAKAVS
jgi:hypothetical protein